MKVMSQGRIPRPLRDDPLPVPVPRGRRSNTSGSNSSEGKPPKYVPSTPLPIMTGFLEKGSGYPHDRSQSWVKKYVEVSDGLLRFFHGRNPGNEMGVEVDLSECFVSVYDKRCLKLESKGGVRIFRAPTDIRANKWAFVISRYCSVAPTAEGNCLKLSGGKNALQDRYLRLTSDGIVSWYKSDKEDADPKGAIQVRGEKLKTDPDDQRVVFVQTDARRFLFQFLNQREAFHWYNAMTWHANREPLENTVTPIRNSKSVR